MSDSATPLVRDFLSEIKEWLKEPGFEARRNWTHLQVEMLGAHRFKRAAEKYPREFLVVALTADSICVAAELAQFFEFAELGAITDRVFQSNDVYAWKELAKTRPEMAELIQTKLLLLDAKADDKSKSQLTPYFFESWLRDVPNTNPVPIQYYFLDHPNDHAGELVDLTIRQPERTCLFATIALLLLKSHNEARHIAHYVKYLCKARPEAVPILQECLLHIGCAPTTSVAVCAAVPGMDLDLMENFILSKWDSFHIKRFCQAVKRERGPARDFLAVEHVMES
jgi:hypothetical protein